MELESSMLLKGESNMKKVFFLMFFVLNVFWLSGCSAFYAFISVSLEHKNPDIFKGEKLWIKKGTKEQVSRSIYAECGSQGWRAVELIKKDLSLHTTWYNVALHQGQCLYDLGYVFKGTIFSKFCIHERNRPDCKAFRKYRK